MAPPESHQTEAPGCKYAGIIGGVLGFLTATALSSASKSKAQFAMPAWVQQPKGIWWKYKVIFNAVGAFLTPVALCVAIWAAWAASEAAREAKEMRFADNLPAFEISSRLDGQGGTALGLEIRNVAKGPGMLLEIGFTDDPKHANPARWEMRLKECVPPSCPYAVMPANFDEIAKDYAKKAIKDESKRPSSFEEFMQQYPEVFGGPPVAGREYYIQFADIFKNQYRQYFYYNGSTKKFVAYGRFEIGTRGDDDPKKWPVDP